MNYRRERAASTGAVNAVTDAVRRYREQLEQFYEIVNSGFNNTFVTPGKLYYKCKPGTSVYDAKQKLTGLIINVLLRTRPGLAVISKWTKLGPVIDFMVSTTIGNMLGKLFEVARGAFAYDQNTGNDGSNTVASEIEWHKVCGSHMRRGLFVATDTGRHVNILIMAIVFEPLRQHHLWLLQTGHSVIDRARWPPVLSLMWAKTSHITKIMQYYSQLLTGRAQRLRLLWWRLGCQDFEDFRVHYPSIHKLLRRSIVVAQAQVRKRLWENLHEAMSILQMGDFRRSPEDLQANVVDPLARKNSCCVPFGGQRKIKKQYPSAGPLKVFFLSRLYRNGSLLASFDVSCTI